MEISRILDQFRRSYEGNAWHGPALAELLKDVRAEDAAAYPIENVHNIWEIVLHVSAWLEVIQHRLKGEVVELSGEQDWPPVKDVTEHHWQQTLSQLEKRYRNLRAIITGIPEEKLPETVPGKDYSVYFMLHGLIQHNHYHAGQIAVLKKAVKKQ